ncbi:MAG: GNAT family N-acetyltransferase [Deltaproteobacteria bacterium]|nr:GNAT family N-acetyltransferase [Deltaproteobacteria bacterium]MBW2017224.1 GNAT family N-acetyltransferase [Deltaproteobacteria bacterium]MBW2130132.1 GNAT family N-acetyltransferase [Deltaproteobacteria bacterium]MBW2304510.1 GNAT family N-acetyltransferase [Deltaproteobacteria bacterium]
MVHDPVFSDYPKEIILKDGTGLTLRPLRAGDEFPLFQMYKELPAEDRWFNDENVTEFSAIEGWVKDSGSPDNITLVAVLEGRILANGRLLREKGSPRAHIGKIRITVVPSYREKNLGTWVLFDLMNLAMSMGLKILVMELVEDRDIAVIRSAKRLDFSPEAILKHFVKDDQGNYRNLIIMVKRLYLGWEYEGGLSLKNPLLRE